MGFKEVTSLDAATTVSLGGKNSKTGKANPTQAEGHYLGFREVETEYGPGKIHFVSTSKGNVGIWGKTDLDKKLSSKLIGQMVRISFTGLLPIPGRKPMYKFKVEVDASNTIDVDGLMEEATETTEEYGDEEVNSEFDPDDSSLDDTDEEGEEEELDVAPPARAVAPKKAAPTPDAARQAKVKALLGKAARV